MPVEVAGVAVTTEVQSVDHRARAEHPPLPRAVPRHLLPRYFRRLEQVHLQRFGRRHPALKDRERILLNVLPQRAALSRPERVGSPADQPEVLRALPLHVVLIRLRLRLVLRHGMPQLLRPRAPPPRASRKARQPVST